MVSQSNHRLRANGYFPNVLSEVEGQAQDERISFIFHCPSFIVLGYVYAALCLLSL